MKPDIIGLKLTSITNGDFTVVEKSHKDNRGKQYYKIRFDIQNNIEYETFVRKDNILNKNIKNPFYSSICNIGYLGVPNYNIYKTSEENKRIENTWRNMIDRCYNINNQRYKNYGKLGIKVCDRWLCFANFLNDYQFINGYESTINKELDKDTKNRNAKIYSLDNCTLVSQNENLKESNKRTQQYLFEATSPSGEIIISDNIKQLAIKYNLSAGHVSSCLNNKAKSHKNWKFKKI